MNAFRDGFDFRQLWHRLIFSACRVPAPVPQQWAGCPVHRVARGKGQSAHPFNNLRVGCSPADLPLLVGRIGADDEEIVRPRQLAVTRTGSKQRDIAGLHGYLATARAAEDQRRRALFGHQPFRVSRITSGSKFPAKARGPPIAAAPSIRLNLRRSISVGILDWMSKRVEARAIRESTVGLDDPPSIDVDPQFAPAR